MNKKVYQEPAMRVVQMQHQGMLMTSDPEPFGSKASINNWGDGGTTDEDIYM